LDVSSLTIRSETIREKGLPVQKTNLKDMNGVRPQVIEAFKKYSWLKNWGTGNHYGASILSGDFFGFESR
jgi:hypothetical protein